MSATFQVGQIVQPEALLHQTNEEAADTNTVITIPAKTDRIPVIVAIQASYSAAPDVGTTITIEDAAVLIFESHLLEGYYSLPMVLTGTKGQALTITLEGGGTGIIGILNAQYYYR